MHNRKYRDQFLSIVNYQINGDLQSSKDPKSGHVALRSIWGN